MCQSYLQEVGVFKMIFVNVIWNFVSTQFTNYIFTKICAGRAFKNAYEWNPVFNGILL